MDLGSIVFGPRTTERERRAWRENALTQAMTIPAGETHACNCIGAQPGEVLCPCALRAESRRGETMVQEGVTVNGRRYRLVPEDAA